MNSNKIINLVDFYQSLGVEYFIDDINVKSLQNPVQEKNLVPESTPKIDPLQQSIKQSIKQQSLKDSFKGSSVSQPMANHPKAPSSTFSEVENIQVSINSSRELPKKVVKTPAKPEAPVVPKVVTPKVELNLDHITTLEALKAELLAFDECSLKKTAINTVFGCGDENSEIMVIGEAPGAEEDELGEPFVGRSGKLLMKAIQSIGLSREQIFITNTIFWRPPGNRNPTIEEMKLCYPFLKRMIEIINPKMVIIVGKVATANLISSDEPIGKMRGKWYDLNINNKTYLSRVVFHPSYLIRSSSQKKSLWLDLLEIKDKIKASKIEN